MSPHLAYYRVLEVLPGFLTKCHNLNIRYAVLISDKGLHQQDVLQKLLKKARENE